MVLNSIKGCQTTFHAFSRALCCPETWALYARFARDYVCILALSTFALSATYLGLLIFALIVAGGGFLAVPLLGIGIICGGLMVSLILISMGMFPWGLFFTLGGGVVASYVYIGQVSFFLTTIFAPMGAANFFLVGLNLFYPPHLDKDNVSGVVKVVKEMLAKKATGVPGLLKRMWGALQMLLFDITVRSLSSIFISRNPMITNEHEKVLMFIITAFLHSFKITSIWTMTIQQKSFLRHVLYAFSNFFFLIGFGGPMVLIRLYAMEEITDKEGGYFHGGIVAVWQMMDLGLFFCMAPHAVGTIEGWTYTHEPP